MAFYVTKGCLDGWYEGTRRRCETILEAAELAEIYDWNDWNLVCVEDENGHGLNYYLSNSESDFRVMAARAGFDKSYPAAQARAAARAAAKKAGKQ